MKVLIMGLGNIGTTLANILLEFKELLKIKDIYLYKSFPNIWSEQDLKILKRKGAILCKSHVTGRNLNAPENINEMDFIFECRENGTGLKSINYYKTLKNLKGVVCQGSEKGFGVPFMSGVNPEAIRGKKYVQVVSCNTHGSASILQAFTGNRLEDLESADFVIVRRSEDLSSQKKLVTANVLARHLNPILGTHHAIDVKDLFKTVGLDVNLTASDVTTPSQLMHAARFNITFKKTLLKTAILKRVKFNPFISRTLKFDSAKIFELGRRYGFQGRIYSHALLVENNLLIEGKSVKGWIFVPQEGNTLLSTLHAFLLQTSKTKKASLINELAFVEIKNKLLVNKEW